MIHRNKLSDVACLLLICFSAVSQGLKCMQPSDARYIQPLVPLPSSWLNRGWHTGQFLSTVHAEHEDETHSRGAHFGLNGTHMWWLQNDENTAHYLLTEQFDKMLCAQSEGGLQVNWFDNTQANRDELWCQWIMETNPNDINLFRIKNLMLSQAVESVQHVYVDETGMFFDYAEMARNDARNLVDEERKWFRWTKAEPTQRNMDDIEDNCVMGASGVPEFLEVSTGISARGATLRRRSPFLTSSNKFATCGNNWYLHGSLCYRTFKQVMLDQKRAKRICKALRGDLVVPKNQEQQTFIVKFLRAFDAVGRYWLGMEAKATGNRFYDTKGNRLTFRRWGRHSKRFRSDKCSFWRENRWYATGCGSQNKLLCVKEATLRNSADCGTIQIKSVDDLMKNAYRSGPEEGRIVKGTRAQDGQFPWQASIRFKVPVPQNGIDVIHNCGGTLIDSCWVLTAAHCVHETDHTIFIVRIGDTNNVVKESSEQEFEIEQIFTHEEYTLIPAPKNDIALIKLASVNGQCARFGQNVQPACLPDEMFPFKDGDRCQVSGWGATNYTLGQRSAAANLMWATLPKLKQKYCKSRYARYDNVYVDEVMFCAGLKAGGRDACTGDSGGPYVCRNKRGKYAVTGVVSFGIGCARRQFPGVYTNVTHFIPWISAKIAANGGGNVIQTN
uniref:Uncharacterized protein LOC100176526 n=1 Tax=Phallusia mammillata TaxID=59560 RepID=A0A6F9DFY9_9ASCI|nr:uncharacterized protein LOC100176526 [Phallusia mammillata]